MLSPWNLLFPVTGHNNSQYKQLAKETLHPVNSDPGSTNTVNSEINVCIYYCDSLPYVQNASLIIAISVNVGTKDYNQKSMCFFY